MPSPAPLPPGAHPPTPLGIAVLGAESTGKSQLAAELARHLSTHGLRAAFVPETLRAWCERAGRAPRPQEQLAIAEAHERSVDQALERADIVIADTTALMVAIYAGQLFEDGELLRYALERQRGYAATLLTGLDLPWVPDGLQRDAAHPREDTDALVRALLQRAGVGFQVVYGSGEQRLRSALLAMKTAGVLPAEVLEESAAPASPGRRPWVWACEKCSDPACEHRLFALLKDARR